MQRVRQASGRVPHTYPRLSIVIFLSLIAMLLPAVSGTSVSAALAASSGTVTAAPAISLSRTQGAPGTIVRVKGLHFSPTASVTVSLGGQSLVIASTAASGVFTATITVPQLPPGSYALTARDGAQLSSSVTFVVTRRPAAHLAITPHKALPGQTLTIQGARFAIGEAVSITLAGSVVTTTATVNGAIAVTTTVPAATPGQYTVTAVGAASGLRRRLAGRARAAGRAPERTAQ